MKFSIVIPCYNEEKNIPLILERFSAVIKRGDIEIILVENGSKDNSKEIISSLLPRYPFAKMTIVNKNQGYGFGILSGLKDSKGDFLGWTHADMQTDPNDVIKACEIIEKQDNPKKCYVKGRRKGRPIFDSFFTAGMSAFESIYLQTLLYDINAQPNIFHREFYASWAKPPFDFSLDLYAFYMAKQMALSVKRFPVLFPERVHGQSSWNDGLSAKFKFIKRTLDYSQKLKKDLKNGIHSSSN